jgi:ActR/RegA family two-component response regulator/glycine cleavage system H lipoate-binding protein
MTVLLVIFMLLAFVGIDYLVRATTHRRQARRDRSAREQILNHSVRLEFNDEAKSLKRVEVPNPKARILAVDDEAVVLDSFRRILVLEGFNIDTVQSGPEALSLVRRNDYDFVFTDLKMPIMDGVEVVKAVKHLRPDVDMVVITGYGTIETAVETMQNGACEYVQKPFSADELAEFVNKLLVKRQARLEALRQPTVRIVSPSQAEGTPINEYCVPGGSFIAPGHTWVRIEPDGQVRVGIDDFASKAMGEIGGVLLPKPGQEVRSGDTLFTCRRGGEELRFQAPVSGKVQDPNAALLGDAGLLSHSPYRDGWVCRIEPRDLTAELTGLKIGRPVVAWYSDEISRLQKERAAQPDPAGLLPWSALERGFFAGAPAQV